MDRVEPSEGTADAARVRGHAWRILLLRGVGIAVAAWVTVMWSGSVHYAAADWPGIAMSVALMTGVIAWVSMQMGDEMKPVTYVLVILVFVAWCLLVTTFGYGWAIASFLPRPLALTLLPSFFLPDLFALWVFLRVREVHRGHLLVARCMVLLCALSTVLVSWLGPAVILG